MKLIRVTCTNGVKPCPRRDLYPVCSNQAKLMVAMLVKETSLLRRRMVNQFGVVALGVTHNRPLLLDGRLSQRGHFTCRALSSWHGQRLVTHVGGQGIRRLTTVFNFSLLKVGAGYENDQANSVFRDGGRNGDGRDRS